MAEIRFWMPIDRHVAGGNLGIYERLRVDNHSAVVLQSIACIFGDILPLESSRRAARPRDRPPVDLLADHVQQPHAPGTNVDWILS
eukprot:6019733-Pyramimonas_sp.AAC.1